MDLWAPATPILFDNERRLRAMIARDTDLAETVTLGQRPAYSSRIAALAAQLPQSQAEALLLSLG